MSIKLKLKPLIVTNKAELKKFVTIINENYEKTPNPLSLKESFTKDKKFFWVYNKNQLVGTTGYHLRYPLLAETIKTVVFKEFRGKGLGKLISQLIEDECHKIGVKKIMTTIYSNNHEMLYIKLKQGYLIEGFHPDHEAPGWHEYSLGKKI